MKLNYFNFEKFDDDFLLTNDLGKYLFLSEAEFKEMIEGKVADGSPLYQKLIDSEMAYSTSDLEFSFEQMDCLRNAKDYLNQATSLHIFVMTTCCNMRCVYCQANNGYSNSNLMMTEEIAEHAVNIALQSTSYSLTFEFQGGEPLLNFPVIQHIVEYTEKMNTWHEINFSLVSNLTLLTDSIINFLAAHNFSLSTSLDGNQLVHDRNRFFADGSGTYDVLCKKLEKLRARDLAVGAIETTTKYSLKHAGDIVRTYAHMGFQNVFLRPLTPLGKAYAEWNTIGYSANEFLDFYREALAELLKINREGVFLSENHASMLMKKLNGIPLNYMELRSPCGAGVGQLAYYADGNIYTCDEGRMLGEMGDHSFLLGNVTQSAYNDLIKNGVCRAACNASVLESIPSCCDCVFQPYCGVCPVVAYATERDIISKNPQGYKCKIFYGIFKSIFELLKSGELWKKEVLSSWGR